MRGRAAEVSLLLAGVYNSIVVQPYILAQRLRHTPRESGGRAARVDDPPDDACGAPPSGGRRLAHPP